ncbi:PIN domain-like protein [Multifurca ochricompacta]|uniref:U three protein 23 n=1 Tax=Multifurca ochricompacta TaxID=376703 RepID=A0AAD4QQD8_9AGAM|nr:PIN domain-like protein [Multifurca ochricompacta]
MRQKRSKAYRKLMAMYSTSFGFRQPFQVLVDSEMCEVTISQKMDLLTQIQSVLVGSVKMMITQCCIHELYLQGKSHQPAVDLAKSFERRKCNHKEAIPGNECIAAVVGEINKHRYVIATQSHPLRLSLRAVPGVPIVHITRSVMILEPASDSTLRAKQRAEQEALAPSTSERAMLKAATPQAKPVLKKKKGAKGPNPLSMKKKAQVHEAHEVKGTKVTDGAGTKKVDVGGKRKRNETWDDGDEMSPETQPKHKRRRRHKHRVQ